MVFFIQKKVNKKPLILTVFKWSTTWVKIACFADRLGVLSYDFCVCECVRLLFLEGNMKKVGIIMGSASDLPVVQKAADVLKDFGVPYEMHIYSAHRTPTEAREFALSARENGFGVIIAAAGMAAHLAGAMAAGSTLPVIGIPIKSSLDGMDALLATVQMPSGIPVATVAIDGAKNAAYLAIEILSLLEPSLVEALEAERAKNAAAILAKDAELNA